jgi:sec-independent protein translocase protein TatB
MEFLGVGPTEFIFIIIIALIVLGPKDLAKTGSTVGKWLNGIIQSDGWKVIRRTSDELRRLPTQLMREDNFKNFLTPDDLIQKAADKKRDAWTGQTGASSAPPRADLPADPKNENTILPPVVLAATPAQTVKPTPKKAPATATKKSSPAQKTGKKPAAKPSEGTRTARKKNA